MSLAPAGAGRAEERRLEVPTGTVSPPGPVVLYDGECRFCRWSLAWVLRWDRRRRLEPVRLQDARAARLLAAMPEAVRMASWHLVTGDGRGTSAGAAVAGLLRLLPGGRPAAAAAARFPGAVERGYALVARNRGRLGRRLTEGALARADAVVARRSAPPPG
ncbi:MAG: DCC1-like thiol-disulfide oxidoreductase family protein [Solirubrobacterales bacterium]